MAEDGEFRVRVKSDAQEFLAGGITAHEFVSSVWHEAGSLSLRQGQATISEEWLSFAHWDDELDEIFLNSLKASDPESVDLEIRAAATELLARFASPDQI